MELGVKFQASTSGFITTLLFYKAAGETGEHDGHLWTSDGTLLATVDFEAETASGWQTAILDTPIAITANTTYVASYHANVFYAFSANYFTTAHVNGSLTALAAGPGEPNGIYHYYASPSDPAAFPDTFFGAPNYWVDVGFVAFTGENFAPEITSGSGNTDVASVFENTTFVTIVAADDANDGQFPVFSIVGGADGAFFQIDPNTGVLTFINAPNFEAHADADGDNVYEVTVQASDSLEPGTLFDQQTISVTVTDTVEVGFEGHEVKAEYIFGDDPDDLIAFPPPVSPGASQTAVVDVTPGAVEFSELPFHDAVELGNGQYGLARVDLEETTVLVEFTLDPAVFGAEGDVTFSNPGFNGVRISDFGGTLDSIVGVSIIDQAGLATPLTLANLIVTANSIFINCNGNNRQVDSDLGTPGIQPTFVLLSVNFNDAPIIISDGGGATATIQGVDGQTLVTTLAATDADNVPTQIQTLTLSVAGGEDGSLFQILNGNELHFITAPDFQSPPPAGATPGYQVLVQVSDGAGGIDTQLITVNLDTDADVGDDLSVSVADELVNNAEKGSVAYTVDGLDADATATVTFSDGVNSVIGVGGLADLSTLDDGPISVSVSATDNAGNSADGVGDSLTLDTDADVDDDLAVSVADDLVSNAEKGSVAYTVNGLDADAIATVTFSDGVNSVIGVGGLADLSTLDDGPISVSVSATDNAGNTATGDGDSLTLDTDADVDDNLSVSVSDELVSNAEKGSVAYTVSGLDADAIATVTFSDGVNSVIGVGGTADLSTLDDGPISVTISALDAGGQHRDG